MKGSAHLRKQNSKEFGDRLGYLHVDVLVDAFNLRGFHMTLYIVDLRHRHADISSGDNLHAEMHLNLSSRNLHSPSLIPLRKRRVDLPSKHDSKMFGA